MSTHASVLELIGQTPIVKVRALETGPCELFLKLENANPGGSIKDRVGLRMIEAAEQRGDIRPGDTLVEGTVGNTGTGLALAARQKGYRLILVVPDRINREQAFNLEAMGADVRLTRSDVGADHPEHYRNVAARVAVETPGSYYVNQFANPDNPATHERWTGPEILEQTGSLGGLDAVVLGCGSGGTLAGLSRCFSRHAANIELVLADPSGSILAGHVDGGRSAAMSGASLVAEIGQTTTLPPLADFSRVARAYRIEDRESFLMARELLSKEGILGGASTGTMVAAALRYCREQVLPKRVLTFVGDTGNKYLSKIYNDYWMRDNGFLEQSRHGDLRDLIQRPYSRRDTIVVAPADSLTTAYQRMKRYGVSQLPVMKGDDLVGIVDEGDVLLHIYGDEERFHDPVSIAMIGRLDRLDVKSPIESLLPIFGRGHVAIVTDDDRFVGLITRIDLLNHLRRQAK
ncbi:MAG: pyridoxal-phosphate dependent enzyme [Xanthomonadaceae bacterium]|jgi:cystathionine beta-synthase|nr:pyridoxal-phosphate dependent enzyme [Xanthomonadaceae bacterium]